MFMHRKSVLHIDDESLITRIVAEQLRDGGYQSEAVNDPLLAMSALVRGQHRIVLLDIHMPHRSGLQLLSDIKTYDAGIHVIMLTGLVNETTVLEAIRHGAEACLFKPLSDPRVLLDAIDSAFESDERWWRSMADLTRRRKHGETPVSV
jgi:CheY-like chemotaxis protein